MGSLYDLLDIGGDLMAKKAVTQKRHDSGLEAPRNSLELPIDKYYGLYTARDNILYAHNMARESAAKDRPFYEAPIKKLISEDISKKPYTKQNAPSVVARLMGVDTLPPDSKPTQQALCEKGVRNSTGKLADKQKSKKAGSVGHVRSTSNCSELPEVVSLGHYDYTYYTEQCSSHMKETKPKRREHPQEEELQKFKKEFEAWQAARFNECSNVAKFGSDPAPPRRANSSKVTKSERLPEIKTLAEEVIPDGMVHYGSSKRKSSSYSSENMDSQYASRMSGPELMTSHGIRSDEKVDIASAPTKIVILRPGPDRMQFNEDSWNNTPRASEDRGNIEDFLQEVKERLKCELQGKPSKRSTTARGGGIETPYREKPSEPKRIAQRIAQEVRDSVSRDLEMNLPRSESTRSYRSEIQLNGAGSPEFINRDTRRLLAERLRNVLKGETDSGVPTVVRNRSRLSMSDYEKTGFVQSKGPWRDNKKNFMDSLTNELEKHSRSFRREPDEGGINQRDMSPRNLIRSLSAPVSGTSFGKLLLEDRHVLTGVQIRRKHEVIEKIPANIKKSKKDKFSIKEKVSSFRYNLTLRGRLFRKRVKSVDGLDSNRNYFLREMTSGPTVTMSFCEANENSTEVPPSPASVCSSVHDEFWRPTDYLSPMSSTGGNQFDDSEMSHVFREINSNLTELRRKLNQFEESVLEETTISKQQPVEDETDIEDQAEAYIRDLLIAAGLYDGSFSRSLTKWDPLSKPISAQVFEEVEETYEQSTKNNEFHRKDDEEKVNHHMILDLLNEVLPTTLRELAKTSKYMEKVIGTAHKPPPCGRKLLSRVWDIAREYIHPPADTSRYTLDYMLARDLDSNPWSRVMDDDINGLGRGIECCIIGDMIDEMVDELELL